MPDSITPPLYDYALMLFRCGVDSVHGPAHWHRVDATGRLICEESPADLLVVRYFAFLHDAYRMGDGADMDHGPRAADGLANLPPSLAILDAWQMALLDYAIRNHTAGLTTEDPTIGACWDSDRLDLGRVGIVPAAAMMSTAAEKRMAGRGRPVGLRGR